MIKAFNKLLKNRDKVIQQLKKTIPEVQDKTYNMFESIFKKPF
jgi:hypothetical protein